jgi:RND family efflux transporter MFP subunit
MVIALPVMFSVLLLLAAGCNKAPPPSPPPPKVTISLPLRREVTEYLGLTGNTQASNTVQLVARVPGYLDKVFFQDGQMVKKGQPLFLIQQDTYLAGLRQAEGQVLSQRAQLVYAQGQLKRYLNLLPQKAASQTDVATWRYQRDSARAGLKTAEANRDLARYNLNYTQVNAPFDGRIDRRLQDPGNLVGAGANTVLAVVSQIDPINVYFTISDSDFSQLMKHARSPTGQAGDPPWPVFIGLAGEEGYPHKGRIDFASVSFNPTTGTLLMRGVLPNPDGHILPGLYSRVHVPVQTRDALLVPDTSVKSDLQGQYVLVVDSRNIVERRNVRTGFQVDYLRVIEEGLTGYERVVVKGMLKAVPGHHVTPVAERYASGRDPLQDAGSAEMKP